MDVKQLKAKMKSINDFYRQELHKIEKNKKSSYGIEEVNTPKLKDFGFMKKIICQRF